MSAQGIGGWQGQGLGSLLENYKQPAPPPRTVATVSEELGRAIQRAEDGRKAAESIPALREELSKLMAALDAKAAAAGAANRETEP